MTTLAEITTYVDDYLNPDAIGFRAIDSITLELYKSNPALCESIFIDLYRASVDRFDRELRVTILYKWLDFTNCNSKNALTALNSTYLSDLLSYESNSELKARILQAWIQFKPIHNIQAVTELLFEWIKHPQKFLSEQNRNKLHTARINRLYLPDSNTQLDLINTYILPNMTNITADTRIDKTKFYNELNTIICKLKLKDVQDNEAIKLLALAPYLEKHTLTKLSQSYMPNTYALALETAQALGVDTNPDYWVQVLNSQQQKYPTPPSTALPEFNY